MGILGEEVQNCGNFLGYMTMGDVSWWGIVDDRFLKNCLDRGSIPLISTTSANGLSIAGRLE